MEWILLCQRQDRDAPWGEAVPRRFTYQYRVSKHALLCEQRLCWCVCVYLCGFFSLLCTLPTGLCLRTVPTGLVPLIVGQAPICGQVTLFLNLAGQKNLFLHSQDCCEGLDWDWLWVSSYLESSFSKFDIYILDINILVGDWIFTFQSGSL